MENLSRTLTDEVTGMRIPKKVRITSKVSYEIVYIEEFEDKTTVGECRGEKNQIVLKIGQSKTDMFKTFLHEILHAIEYEYNVSLPHVAIYKMEDAIERILVLNKWV